MKKAVNLRSRASLEASRRELQDALAVIEFALSKLPSATSNGLSPLRKIAAAIESMGVWFTSSEVYERIPDVPRSTIKTVLRRLEEAGQLRVGERGAGRRPTAYQKIDRTYS